MLKSLLVRIPVSFFISLTVLLTLSFITSDSDYRSTCKDGMDGCGSVKSWGWPLPIVESSTNYTIAPELRTEESSINPLGIVVFLLALTSSTTALTLLSGLLFKKNKTS